MKSKIAIIVLLAMFAFGLGWIINHTYIVVNFWLGIKIMGGFILALVLAFFAGRWTAPYNG